MAGKPPKQEETGSERALGRIGSERYARFMEKFAPLEKEFLSDIADQREERRAQVNMASNDAAIAGSQVQQAAGLGLPREGNALGLASTATDTAAAAGLNRSQLESDLNAQHAGDLGALVAQGSGQAGQAISGMSSAAEAAGRRAAEEARMRLRSQQATRQAAMTGLGIGAALTPASAFQSAAGSALGAGTSALGLMSPSGQREAFNQPGGPQQSGGITGYPYPGA